VTLIHLARRASLSAKSPLTRRPSPRARFSHLVLALSPLALSPLALSLLGCAPTDTVQSLPPPNTIHIQAGNSGTSPGKSITLAIGDTVRIQVGVLDIFGAETGVFPSFFSRDIRVATVNSGGLILANGIGSAYVTAFVTTTGSNFIGDSILVNVSGGCTLEARAGITIAVQDSLTGSSGPFSNVSYVAKDTSTFQDSTFIASVPAQVSGSPFLVGLAYEHAGKYTVTVRATGYRSWIKTGVVVGKDACHVIGVSLTARLALP
jgi:hypothetical protein